jgi:hypothetical protein
MRNSGNIIFAHLRHFNLLVLVCGGGQRVTIEYFNPFSIGCRGGKATGNIVGHVAATHGDSIGKHQLAFVKHPNRGGAAAHINNGCA